jgi:hypothetical protein
MLQRVARSLSERCRVILICGPLLAGRAGNEGERVSLCEPPGREKEAGQFAAPTCPEVKRTTWSYCSDPQRSRNWIGLSRTVPPAPAQGGKIATRLCGKGRFSL